jgi:hypothetical protein
VTIMTISRLSGSRALMLALPLAGAALIPIAVSSGVEPSVREIRLVARNMTYYVEGATDPNPILHLRRGEQVRIVLTNNDPGMIHDFGIDALRIRTRLIDDKSNGNGTVLFTAPDTPLEATYSCTPHTQMMRGTIRVE